MWTATTFTNVAVQVLSALIVTVVDACVPVQSPAQPVNIVVAADVAVSVTDASGSNSAEHRDPQFMPGPDTLPDPFTETVKCVSADTMTCATPCTPLRVSVAMTCVMPRRPART